MQADAPQQTRQQEEDGETGAQQRSGDPSQGRTARLQPGWQHARQPGVQQRKSPAGQDCKLKERRQQQPLLIVDGRDRQHVIADHDQDTD